MVSHWPDLEPKMYEAGVGWYERTESMSLLTLANCFFMVGPRLSVRVGIIKKLVMCLIGKPTNSVHTRLDHEKLCNVLG